MSNNVSSVEFVWVFVGNKGRFASAVFSTYEKAIEWIENLKVSGTLYKYPIDYSVYDWSQKVKFFDPKKEKHFENDFIANFTSACIEHCRFDKGNVI